MNVSLRVLGLLGLLLFGSFFALTFGVPEAVEKSAKGFVQSQVQKEVREKIAPITESSVVNKAKALADKLGFQESQLKKDLENNLPEKIASIMAQMCGYDCEKKKQLANDIKDGYLDRIKNLKVGQINLSQIVQGKYVEIVGNLKLDLRIFSMSNTLMFLLLVLISLIKPQAIKHLYLPGFLLFVATVVATSFYLFGQDWFYRIIYNDYMGFAYLVYLAIIFGFMIDVVLNKCRITSFILNMLGHAITGIGSVSPC